MIDIVATARTSRIVEAEEYTKPWHKWFAWKPVFVDGKRVWLRNILRYGHYNSLCGFRTEKHLCEPMYNYEYADI